jgi:curved DNA-binding protein CbpA
MKIGTWEASLDLYAILGVRDDATSDQIRSAYRRRIFDTHPDMHGARGTGEGAVAEARAKRVNVARAILLDPTLRNRYDALRAARRAARPSSHRSGRAEDARCGDFWPFGHVWRPADAPVAEVYVPPPPPIGGLAATLLLVAGFVVTFATIAWLAAPIETRDHEVAYHSDVGAS